MSCNKINLRNDQYADEDKLIARQNIYKYSVKKYSFWQWAAKKYKIGSLCEILEVGAGNGLFWLDAMKIYPNDIKVTLSDYSPGMMRAARQKLKKFNNFNFCIEDIEKLSFDDASFDFVLSHFMLYHVNSVTSAIKEMIRVLKPQGSCGIILPDNNHMREIFSIIDWQYPKHAQPFNADHAKKILPNFFGTVKCYEYTDTVITSDVKSIIDYIKSLSDMDSKPEEMYDKAEKKLNHKIAVSGKIELIFKQYLFVCSN